MGIVAMGLLTTTISAQNMRTDGNVSVQVNRVQQLGDSLYIDMDITKIGKNATSRNSADFTPIIISETIQKALPSVSLKGRSNYKGYRRAVALMSNTQRADYDKVAPYAVVPDYKKRREVINYNVSVPYESWMSSARIDLRKDDCGCGKTRETDVRMLANKIDLEKIIIIERYNITPFLSYVTPEVEAVKQREVSAEAFLDFVVGKTEIRPDYMNNPVELRKITDLVNEIKSDNSLVVNKINIIGYASPEGSFAGNQRLSEGRAKALANYLSQRFDYPRSMYREVFGGENWSGLKEVVEQSSMPYRQQVLDLIANNAADIDYLNNASLKKYLMDLAGGNPWRYMLKEYFPSLRKAICKIDYEVKSFDLAEAREIFKSKPQNLSLNEMFIVANSYGKDSQEYKELFETAVRMYPNDATANLNAGIAALERKDYVSAEKYLNNVNVRMRTPEYDNAMGVLYMMRDNDFAKSEVYFKSAADAGLEQAKQNMDEIKQMLENLDQIKQAEIKQKR